MNQIIIGDDAPCPFSVCVSGEAAHGAHFHSELELLFVLRGSVTYLLQNTRWRLSARDFIFANPYEIHGVDQASGDCRYVLLSIDESRMRHLFSSGEMLTFGWQESLNNREQPLYREIADSVRNIVLEGVNCGAGYLAKAYREVLRILIALNEQCRQPAGHGAGRHTASRHQKSCEIMDYINTHYSEPLSLNTVSRALFLSPPYISKIFKEHFQIGFLEYVNRLRVQKSVAALCRSDAYVAEIAAQCGFSNAKTYSRIFQREMGISPTEYRRRHAGEAASRPVEGDAGVAQLLEHSGSDGSPAGDAPGTAAAVWFDFTRPHAAKPPHVWNKILYAGTAELLLQQSVQQAVLRAIREFDVEYVRFTGAFSDGLQTYQEDESGTPRCFWVLLDEVLRFLTDHRVKPMIVLGYMPGKLAASEPPSPFYWTANTGAPKSSANWEAYLKAFLRHLVQAFSYEEVCAWRFEFWNDPTVEGIFWHDGRQAFREFFLVSYRAFRAVLLDGQFGSPGFMFLDDFRGAEDFLTFCMSRGVQFDFLCLHLFELTDPCNPGTEQLNALRARQTSGAHGPHFVAEAAKAFRAAAERAGYRAPIAITEWNVSPYFHDLARDTAFMGAYIFDTVNRLPSFVESLSFWSLTDYTAEHSPRQDVFSGELGQRTINDLAKPSYLAFQLLKRMQGGVLESGEFHCITRSNHGYHIALYNCVFFNDDFLSGRRRPLSQTDRYQIFEQGAAKSFVLELTMEPGRYRLERHLLDREHGSIYDGWVRMGAPEFIDTTCRGYLDKLAYPEMSIEYRNIRGSLIVSEQVPPHGILLLSLIRLGDESAESEE